MANIIHVSYISFILACVISLSCEAIADENPKLHIIYMGSLPKTPSYSPTSHHHSMLQKVFDIEGVNSTKYLIHSYKRSFNGFAAMLINDQQRQKLAEMEGVISVFPSKTIVKHTTKSWDFIGFPKSVKRNHTTESDIVIGVFDTGIWPESESFSDHGFGPIPKKWKGTCAGGNNFTCNNKIIGARFYTDESARDTDGHGSHTSSTAAGNWVDDASFYGLAEGTARGGVPSARLAMYKVCGIVSCSEHSILAAFDDAIADGVDIISISLGSFLASELYNDVIAIGGFHAMAKDILTVHSAGNGGPISGTVVGVAPWELSVAASNINRQFICKIVLGNGVTIVGKSINSFTSNGTRLPIVSTQLGGDIKGKIALCGYSFDEDTVYAEGGVGAIVGVHSLGYTPSVKPLPSVALYDTDYDHLESYTNSSKDPKGEIFKSEIAEDHTAPSVAEFSSRGPNRIVPEILKPDITAPGVEILASYSPNASPSGNFEDKRSVKYNILSGTSMSCPHVTGIAAYVKSFHLDWSPAAIKSAIMTTAKPLNVSGDKEIGEYAYGSGQISPTEAIDPGLVYDIGKEDYINMLCNLGYDNEKIKVISGESIDCSKQGSNRSLVKNLNYPALVVEVGSEKNLSVSFNRTVTNVGLANSNYKVTILPSSDINIKVVPEILSFKSLYEKQSFVVTVTGGKLQSKSVFVSALTWSDGKHKVRSPIVVSVSSKI